MLRGDAFEGYTESYIWCRNISMLSREDVSCEKFSLTFDYQEKKLLDFIAHFRKVYIYFCAAQGTFICGLCSLIFTVMFLQLVYNINELSFCLVI